MTQLLFERVKQVLPSDVYEKALNTFISGIPEIKSFGKTCDCLCSYSVVIDQNDIFPLSEKFQNRYLSLTDNNTGKTENVLCTMRLDF